MYRYTSIDNDPVVQGTSHCLEISIAIAFFFPFTSCCFFGELCIIVKTERSWLLRRCTVAVNRPSWDLRTIWINKNAWILLFKIYCRFGWYLHEKKKDAWVLWNRKNWDFSKYPFNIHFNMNVTSSRIP